MVRISKTLQRTPRPLREQHGEWIEQPTKTRRSTRAIPLARIASDELRRLRDLPSKTISGGRSPGLRDRLVFCRADGRPISGNHLSRSLQRALSDADLPRFDSTICDTRRRHFSRSRGSLSPSPWPSLATRTPARPLTSIRGWLPNWLARRQRQWTGSWLGDRSPIVRDRVNINQTARMRMKGDSHRSPATRYHPANAAQVRDLMRLGLRSVRVLAHSTRLSPDPPGQLRSQQCLAQMLHERFARGRCRTVAAGS